MIVEHISYDQIEGEYDSTILTAEKKLNEHRQGFQGNQAYSSAHGNLNLPLLSKQNFQPMLRRISSVL